VTRVDGNGGGRVVVVGAGAAGLRAAESLRRSGWAGDLVVAGAEPRLPYNRPPVSKELLAGRVAPDALTLRVARAAKDADWRPGRRVDGADLGARTVTLDGGDVLAWDGLVVATGLRPRRLDLPGPSVGRHLLRTVDDAVRLRADLRPGGRLVVLGAGFVGCEVAAVARGLGVEVDVVAPETAPVERALGAALGSWLRRRHEAHGVRFHLGRVPVALDGGDRVRSVLLDDGTELRADAVLEAVGSVPNTEWLAGSGLDLADGVLCDGLLRAGGRADVVACGDVARFPNPVLGPAPRRVEHWTWATETGRRAGRTLAEGLLGVPGDGTPFAPVPSFWSDQYDVQLQAFGLPDLGLGDVRVLEGAFEAGAGSDPGGGGEFALGYHAGGELVGAVLVGLAARHAAYRDAIAARGPRPDRRLGQAAPTAP
jgi:NADPH-dependent 2,4-dienoyl-CoA reductase/sulfur reductase-like enzyme